MKKMFKKSLALLMVIAVLFTSVPFAANAQNETDNAAVDTPSEASFKNQTALDIIANGLMEGEANESYAVSYLEMSGMTAIVDVGNIAECQLVVAIYDEDTRQMYASGIADVPVEHGKIEVKIDADTLPDYYIVKAFLIDEDYAPLCDAYESLMYTHAYEQFLAVTPEDYSDEEVIIFDDTKEQADFAVIDSSAISSETSADMTFEYDETTLTFTFYNAIEDVKNLSVGDVYYYEYGDLSNEFLLFKVKSIFSNGSTVTIVQDENVSLSEVFSFVRIDAEGDYDNVDVDESNLSEGVTPVDESDTDIVTNSSVDFVDPDTESKKFSYKFEIKYKKPDSLISISASVGFDLVASTKLVYDLKLFGKDYYEFKSEIKTVTKLSGVKVTGKLELPEDYCEITIAKLPIGPFVLSGAFKIIAEISASVSFDITYTQTIVATADSDDGFNKTANSESDWDMELEDKLEIKIGLGVSVSLAFGEVAHSHLLKLKVSGDFGLKYTGKADTVGVWTDKHHDCIVCTNGEVVFFVSAGIKLTINIVKDLIDFEFNIANWSYEHPLFDFYISLNKDGFSCGKGACDRIWYKVNVTVKDKNKKVLDGVRVFTDTGVCDADSDGNYNETEMLTDADGKAAFYFKEGSHSIVAKCDGYIMETEVVNIIAKEKSVTLYLEPDTSAEPDTPTEPESPEVTYIASGTCGDNLAWGLTNDGLLVIDGIGEMYDYSINEFSPWYTYRNDIIGIEIFEGVTSIGEYAFYDCDNFRIISIPRSINTEINKTVFENCLINCVVVFTACNEDEFFSIWRCGKGYYAYLEETEFRYYDDFEIGSCGENLTATINFSSGVMKISGIGTMTDFDFDEYNFLNTPWLGLEEHILSIEISEGITSIGSRAFLECLYISHIKIPKSVKCIGQSAFGKSLTSIEIPNSVTSISELAFVDCYILTDIFYTGSKNEWQLIETLPVLYMGSFYDFIPSTATIHYDSNMNVETKSVGLSNTYIIANSLIVDFETLDYDACISGNNYILLSVSDYTKDFVLTTDNLYYIDQLVADESGTVSTSFIPKSNDKRTTTLLIGDFGNGVQIKILKAGYDYSDCKISIVPYNNLSLDYGDVVYLTVQTNNMPEGTSIIWSVTGNGVKYSVSEDGTTCKVTATGNGEVTIKAYVVDKDGNLLLNINRNAIHSARKINVDGSFWKIILYFIRSLFGITKTAFQAV